jgi:hypothetical protein
VPVQEATARQAATVTLRIRQYLLNSLNYPLISFL